MAVRLSFNPSVISRLTKLFDDSLRVFVIGILMKTFFPAVDFQRLTLHFPEALGKNL
jgi:hypothetical protein